MSDQEEHQYGFSTTVLIESRLPRFTECIDKESECVSSEIIGLDDSLKVWLWWFVCAAFAKDHGIADCDEFQYVVNGFEFELFEALATELTQ
jgi:hypothetical protein